MQFLTPLYLAGGALVALPIVLHLLRRDVAPRVPFTAVRLLRGAPIDRSRRRRLQDLLLLVARIAALLLLAASFARPYRAGGAGANHLTIVALDRSFSMGAPGVFDRARALARAAIDEAGSGRVALIAFDDRAEVVSAPGLGADAKIALAALQPSAGGTRYASAFDKAADLAADDRGARVILVSDLQRSGFDGASVSLPRSVDLSVRDASGARGNVALTDLRADGLREVATVRNFSPAPAQATVRLQAGGVALPARTITVPADGSAQVAFDDVPRGPLHATISGDEGYPADNDRFAVAAGRVVPRVVIVSGGPGSTAGFYFSRALLAGGDEGPDFDVRVVSGSAFSAMSAADAAQCAALVVLSTHGLDRRAGDVFARLLDSGTGIFIAAAPDVDATVLSTLLGWEPAVEGHDRADAGVLALSDVRHPIFRPFGALAANLGQVSFTHAWRVNDGNGWRTIATYSGGGAALLERSDRRGRVLLFTSDVDRRWNDFPLHTAFVPFVQETARYLGAQPPDETSWTVADVPVDVPRVPGVVTAGGRPRAINVDARESTVDRVNPAQFAQLVTRTADPEAILGPPRAQDTESRQGLWRYGLALMLATLIAEAFLGSR